MPSGSKDFCSDSTVVEDCRAGILRKGRRGSKASKKRWFVLHPRTQTRPPSLDYYDSEQKYKQGKPPKQSIDLDSCFNINRTADPRFKNFCISLYTGNEVVLLGTDSEMECQTWLNDLLQQMYPTGPFLGFEHCWDVNVIPNKGITETKADVAGAYRLCLCPRTFDMASTAAMILYRVQGSSTPPRAGSGSKPDSPSSPNLFEKLEFPLVYISSYGHQGKTFHVKLGRSAVTGSGVMYMETEDPVIAESIQSQLKTAIEDNNKSRQRSQSFGDQRRLSVIQSGRTATGPLPRGRTESSAATLTPRNRTTSESEKSLSNTAQSIITSPYMAGGTSLANRRAMRRVRTMSETVPPPPTILEGAASFRISYAKQQKSIETLASNVSPAVASLWVHGGSGSQFGGKINSPFNISSDSVNSGASSEDRHHPHLISNEVLSPPIAEENSGDGSYVPMDYPLRAAAAGIATGNYMFMGGGAKANSEATSGTKSIDSSCDVSMDESASIRCYSMGSRRDVPPSSLPAKGTMRSISHSGAVTTVTPVPHATSLSSRLQPAVDEDRKRAHSFGNWSQPMSKFAPAGRHSQQPHHLAAPVLSVPESVLTDEFRPRSESNPGNPPHRRKPNPTDEDLVEFDFGRFAGVRSGSSTSFGSSESLGRSRTSSVNAPRSWSPMVVQAVIEKAPASKGKEIPGTVELPPNNYMPLSPSQQLLMGTPGRLSPIQQGAASDYVQMDIPRTRREASPQMPSSDYVLMGVDPPPAIRPDPPSSTGTGNDSGFTTDDSSTGAATFEAGQKDKAVAPMPHRPLIAQDSGNNITEGVFCMVDLKDQLPTPQSGEYMNMEFAKPKKFPSPRIRNPGLHINTGNSAGGSNQMLKTIHSAPAMPTEKSPTKSGKLSPNNPLMGKIQTFFTGAKTKNPPPAPTEPSSSRDRQHSGPLENPMVAAPLQPRSRRSYPGPGPLLHQNASDSRLPTISAEPVTPGGGDETPSATQQQQLLDYASLLLPANPSASQSGLSPSHGAPLGHGGPCSVSPRSTSTGNPPQFLARDSEDSVSYAEIDLAKSEGLKKAASNARS